VIAKINKSFGPGTVCFLGRDAQRLQVEVVPTQSWLLNCATGIGGFPKGRITEIFGPEHTGKTGICLGAAAECQKAGGMVGWIDPENALDPDLARLLGVNLDDLVYCQPDTGEEALNVMEALIRSGGLDLIVLDSVAALVPAAEAEADMSQQLVGTHARLMSKAMRKLVGIIASHKVAVVFINQIREKVGVMYGSPETPTGGRALRFFASLRIEVRRGEDIKDKETILGHYLRCRILKNRLSVPFKRCEIAVLYGQGIDQVDELVQLGQQVGVVQRAGSWYTLVGPDGEAVQHDGRPAKVNSRDALLAYLRERPELVSYLEDTVRSRLIRPTLQDAQLN
jgi:recombination protein RecA